jgi:serine/threonine protein kinase/thioredoxin-like negative regulator of GroEL
MPADDLPITQDAQQASDSADAALGNTTVPKLAASSEATPGLDLRGYELVERLGGGGMGDVYCAVDPALGRDLAVKVMKADLQGHASAELRFIREARVTGSLQHPGIVPVYNLGRLIDGRLHYTMRLVRGRTFAAILKDEAGRPERLPALLAIFEKMCQAVAYAHSKRVIHRDLKPANVMVGSFGEVQVMDWGLAKMLTPGERNCLSAPSEAEEAAAPTHSETGESPPDLTWMGHEMGTPSYMPPEQALGAWDTVDERADVFALGAILCEILTGQSPYRSGDSGEALRKAKQGDLTKALTRLEGCGADAALMELCRDCLAPAREDRPRDADRVAQRLATYQAEVQERLRRAELERAAAVVKVGEERKRRRLAIVFVLLLSVAAAICAWLAVRATDSAQREHQANELAQNRLGQIEKANDVLASIFGDLDPLAEEKGGPSLRLQMAQHLEKAAAQLDDLEIGDPLTAGRLQHTLGRSLGTLGQARAAIPLLSKAYQIRESGLGPDHPDTLKSMLELGMAYHADGQLDKSIALLEPCLERQKVKLGLNHPATLPTINVLAGIYIATHQFDKAEPFVPALEAQEAVEALSNLAMAYRLTGQIDKALPISEFVVKIEKAKRGLNDPETLGNMTGLASAYHHLGQVSRAIQVYEEILPRQRALLPADHRSTLTTMLNLGLAYCTAGQAEKGIPLLEQSWQRVKAKFAPGTATVQHGRITVARGYLKAGEFDRADVLLREGLDWQRTNASPESPTTLRLQAMLGYSLLHQRRYIEAEPLLRQCLKVRDVKQPDAAATFAARALLGEALLGQKKLTEAEPLLLNGCEGMKKHEAESPLEARIRVIEALEALVRLYETSGQTDQAAHWRTELAEAKARQKSSEP